MEMDHTPIPGKLEKELVSTRWFEYFKLLFVPAFIDNFIMEITSQL